jgi:hypothetical protein
VRARLQVVKEMLRRRMHEAIDEQGAWLRRVVMGFNAYLAVPTYEEDGIEGVTLIVARHSVQGACDILRITPQTIFDWLKKGWLSGKQLAKGMPWQIFLTEQQATELKARVRHTTRSRKEAP